MNSDFKDIKDARSDRLYESLMKRFGLSEQGARGSVTGGGDMQYAGDDPDFDFMSGADPFAAPAGTEPEVTAGDAPVAAKTKTKKIVKAPKKRNIGPEFVDDQKAALKRGIAYKKGAEAGASTPAVAAAPVSAAGGAGSEYAEKQSENPKAGKKERIGSKLARWTLGGPLSALEAWQTHTSDMVDPANMEAAREKRHKEGTRVGRALGLKTGEEREERKAEKGAAKAEKKKEKAIEKRKEKTKKFKTKTRGRKTTPEERFKKKHAKKVKKYKKGTRLSRFLGVKTPEERQKKIAAQGKE